MIQFSTPEVYGSTPSFIDENYKHNPSTPYAISRNCFDNHLLALNKTQNFPVILTRTANVYGPYQDLYRIIPKTLWYHKKIVSAWRRNLTDVLCIWMMLAMPY